MKPIYEPKARAKEYGDLAKLNKVVNNTYRIVKYMLTMRQQYGIINNWIEVLLFGVASG